MASLLRETGRSVASLRASSFMSLVFYFSEFVFIGASTTNVFKSKTKKQSNLVVGVISNEPVLNIKALFFALESFTPLRLDSLHFCCVVHESTFQIYPLRTF